LIVDDERVITNTFVTIFLQKGYEAKGAYSAGQALAELETWSPELVITDVWLPNMNGIDLLLWVVMPLTF
jgi:DNA-binding response OmpR family regulator